MRLTAETIQKLRESLRMKNRLAYEMGKSAQTIQKYIQYNHPNLTRFEALKIISEETGIKVENLVETEKMYA